MKPLLSDITVNGKKIPAELIASEAQNHPAPKSKPGMAWMAAARALAIRTLVLQEANRLGFEPDPQQVAEGKVETDEEALVRQVLDVALDPPAPSPQSLRAAYDAAPDRWRAPTLYEAAHILFPVKPGDVVALAKARAAASAVLTQLQRDPRAFGGLAREHSACSSRDNGGRLGQLISGDTVPEFEAVLDALDEGSLAPEPVATRYGLHIMRLDARAQGAVLPFEAVAPRIAEMLEKAAWVKAGRDFVARLARDAEVSGITLVAAA
ncbi:peptidylprolyl isomerase [Hoeflea sp. YIM 152468]|uniref:peptidylprolyl isomerase n=1 Tax=Hoeflea sp. YIM 152468 TaxID=3031759 RepID=UPI0023DA8CAF|nr:peptidylprolyl isomerase [Hoeflea sp. YIM 152468]MDF1606877.1 peptidylprolyl isomerase [Hoeflea sp. YIM 152468]